MTTSTPLLAWSRACFTFPHSAITVLPIACACAVNGPGLPRPAMTTGTRSSSVTSIQPFTASVKRSLSPPVARIVANRMSTPNGLSVASRTRRISVRRSAGLPCAAAMTPRPPASDTAAPGAHDAGRRQHLEQRLLVHDGAAARVDEKGGRLHEAEGARVHHLARLRRERRVQRHHVRVLHHLVEQRELHAERVLLLLREAHDVVVDDRHPERLRAAGHFLADVAEPDDPERLALELEEPVLRE